MQVLFGKDNFLFLQNDNNHVLNQITGLHKLNDTQIAEWEEEILRRQKHAARYSYRYKFIIPPNKHCIYSEYLPDNIHVSRDRPAIQLAARMPETVMYPLNFLLKRRFPLLYYKNDTHWNSYGLTLVMNYLAEELNLPLLEYELYETSYLGDLGNKISPPFATTSLEVRYQNNARCIFDNKLNNIGRVRIFENNNPSLPTCVIFGDSFFNTYLEIISQFFSRLYYFHAPVFDQEIIENIKPDIVMNENVERFVNKLSPKISFKELTYNKIFDLNYKDSALLKYIQGEEDVSGLSYQTILKFANASTECSDEPEYLFKRYIYHSLVKDLKENLNQKFEFPSYIWHASNSSPFKKWAICLSIAQVNSIKGISFYLQNLDYIATIKINLYEYSRNVPYFKVTDLPCVYENNYSIHDLNLFSNIQEVYFPLNINLCSVPEHDKMILLLLSADNNIGCSAVNSDSHKEEYFLRGYYSLVDNIYLNSCKNGSKIWFRLFYS